MSQDPSGEPSPTRIAILAAARALLEERGPAEVRMTDVARKAGVSRQSVYLHFGTRSGLLVALVEYIDEMERLGPLLEWVFSAPTGIETLDRHIELHAIHSPRIAAVGMALESASRTDEAAQAAWENRVENRLGGAREVVRRLSVDGHLADNVTADEAVDLFLAIGSLPVWRQLVMERSWTAEQYKDHIGRVMRSILVR